MSLIIFLILFPLLPAIALLLFKSDVMRKVIVVVSVGMIAAGSISLAVAYINAGPVYFNVSPFASKLVTGGEIALALTFLFVCRTLPFRRYWIPLLVVVQYGAVIWFDATGRIPEVMDCLFIDNLSIIMCLIIGIVGGLITLYTVGYMRRYHEEHPGIPDRTNRFLAAIFLFFFAMYGIIFSNSLAWIYFFWEITTLCSFIMIGYSRTEEAVRNSFLALWMLLLGGLAFAGAILCAATWCGTIELARLLTTGGALVMLPVVLICFAGMNKAAQFPFSGWLLGAMVAPTPSSALLHSSTMVKAGVYICIRCAPVLHGTAAGHIVALLGGLTFLAGSAIAISQSDAKRVLAYSTVGNLGLIVLCAGVGSHLALWGAVLLVIFHALSKALMFLCVGTVDQQIGSRDIEDMRGLISRMPWVTIMMLVGMAGMFLAPFGMLISKWAVMEALAGKNPVLTLMVIFGGSLMLFFWSKWMGVLVGVDGRESSVEKNIGIAEWSTLSTLAALTVVVCALFPLIGIYLIEPMYGSDPLLSRGHILMLSILMGMIMLLPLGFIVHRKRLHYVEPYLGGANVASHHRFMGSLGKDREWSLGSYYLAGFFGEAKILAPANIAAIALMAVMLLIPVL